MGIEGKGNMINSSKGVNSMCNKGKGIVVNSTKGVYSMGIVVKGTVVNSTKGENSMVNEGILLLLLLLLLLLMLLLSVAILAQVPFRPETAPRAQLPAGRPGAMVAMVVSA